MTLIAKKVMPQKKKNVGDKDYEFFVENYLYIGREFEQNRNGSVYGVVGIEAKGK